jgi:hypothetical protein
MHQHCLQLGEASLGESPFYGQELAIEFKRGDPRTIPYLERAIQIAGDNAKAMLDDWKFATGYSLDILGWPDPQAD